MKVPASLDVHAHISGDIPDLETRALGAYVFAVTRSVAEFESVKARQDIRAIWGVGVHPGLVGVQKAFDETHFRAALDATPLVGEVGLDGTSRVPLAIQLATFRAVLKIVGDRPRLLSVHSAGAEVRVLRELSRAGTPGVILHWWTGGPDLTDEAVRLGCYFSLPPALMSSDEVLARIPPHRILFESDHPYGDRRSVRPRRPGNVREVEERMGARWSLDRYGARIQAWKNLARLVCEIDVEHLFPQTWRDSLADVRAFDPATGIGPQGRLDRGPGLR